MRVRRPSRRRAFTVIELLVVIFIIGFLISIMMPALCRSREQGNRVKCASNLRQIGLGIQMYANDNKGAFPRTYFDESDNPVPTAFTGVEAANPFGAGGPAANDVSAGLYLVLRTQDLTSEVFVCPSSSAERASGDLLKRSNWKSAEEMSYSYNNPYPGKAFRDAVKGGQQSGGLLMRDLQAADFAVAADMNPGGATMTTVMPTARRAEIQRVNSRNHNGDGQNVLYTDGHVEFQTSPFAGVARKSGTGTVRDNIFANNAAPPVILGAMADPLDSVLLPTADPSTAPTPLAVSMNTREFGARRVVWLTSGTVLLGACGSGGLAWRAAKRRKARRQTTTTTTTTT